MTTGTDRYSIHDVTFRTADWLYIKDQCEQKINRYHSLLANAGDYDEVSRTQGKLAVVREILEMPHNFRTGAAIGD